MVAPSLWINEVTNALAVAYLKNRVDLEQMTLALALLQGQGVRLADPEPMECLGIATSFEISGYDAAYVALAEALESELWTGDRGLYERVRDRSGLVRWIGDYRSAG
jgi:predicted nucleic acid-binding protein